MYRFDDRKFKDLLGTSIFGRRFEHLEVTGSTNDYGANLIDNADGPGLSDIDGTLILADRQSGGRGRFNRNWSSPPGGLWFSLIFKTELSLEKIPSLTLIAAFSAADSLICSHNIDVTIKWPNDLYHGDSKFGGILSEEKNVGSSRFIILGMGLNIDVDKKYLVGLENKAVNIQDLVQEKISPEPLLADIIKRFEDMYKYYEKTGDLGSIFNKIERMLRY